MNKTIDLMLLACVVMLHLSLPVHSGGGCIVIRFRYKIWESVTVLQCCQLNKCSCVCVCVKLNEGTRHKKPEKENTGQNKEDFSNIKHS